MPATKRLSIKNIKKTICVQCNLQVEEEDESIQCDKCAKIFHNICTTLDKRQYEHLLQNERDEYICHICSESGGNLKSELSIIKTQLNKLNQLDALQETMKFMSKQFDDILKGVADNKKKLDVVQKENKNLRIEVTELKTSIKMLNDQRVKNDCIVNGVVCEDGADAVETFVKIMEDVGVNIQSNEIDEAYFLRKRNKANKQTKQSMVIKFNSRKTKQMAMSSKPKLRENEDTKNVFINDFLGKETLALLNHARSLKNVGYRGIYVMAGKVYVKRSELSKPKIIKTVEDVDILLLDATTNNMRRSLRHDTTSHNIPDDSEDEVHSPYLSPS